MLIIINYEMNSEQIRLPWITVLFLFFREHKDAAPICQILDRVRRIRNLLIKKD